MTVGVEGRRLKSKKWNSAFHDRGINIWGIRSMNIKKAKELPIYLTLKEVAELLKVKPRTVYAWVSERKVPFERKGGLLRFRLDAIVEWNEPKSGRLEPSFAILGDASRRRL